MVAGLVRWRLGNLLYGLATQLIILLGALRGWLVLRAFRGQQIRKDRTFVTPCLPYGTAPRESYRGEQPGRWYVGAVACCDCGLEHKTWIELGAMGPAEFSQPMRPKDYGYRLRLGAGAPSDFVPEDDRWQFESEERIRLGP